MKKILLIAVLPILFACNNSKKDKPSTGNPQQQPANNTGTATNKFTGIPSNRGAKITVEGKEVTLNGSLLVSKDKKKLQPGADYMCILTAYGSQDIEGMSLNFLLDLKPGTYPVVGMGLHRKVNDQAEIYGGLMGGEEKLTDYKVNINECKDLGSNNAGGHKWSISGTFDDLVIPAMGLMIMDKTKNHPKEIKVQKGSFFNLTFDDNWDQMMEEGMKKFKEKNK